MLFLLLCVFNINEISYILHFIYFVVLFAFLLSCVFVWFCLICCFDFWRSQLFSCSCVAFLLPCLAFYFVGGVIYCFVDFVVLCANYVPFVVYYIWWCGGVVFCRLVCSFGFAKLMIWWGAIFAPKLYGANPYF